MPATTTTTTTTTITAADKHHRRSHSLSSFSSFNYKLILGCVSCVAVPLFILANDYYVTSTDDSIESAETRLIIDSIFTKFLDPQVQFSTPVEHYRNVSSKNLSHSLELF